MKINRRAAVFINHARAGELIEYRDKSLSDKERYLF
jgi:hypothetical protein